MLRTLRPAAAYSRAFVIRPPGLTRQPLLPTIRPRLPTTTGAPTRSTLFSTSTRRCEKEQSNLGKAMKDTKIEWYNIPVGLGIALIAVMYIYRRESAREEDTLKVESDGSVVTKPGKGGPWQVWVLSTLPLKALSRAWGWFNEIDLPRPLRVPGFKLYSWIFGANIAEAEEDDLRNYRNLAEFFYRRLKPGSRPIDPDAIVVSPSDGKVLHFGKVLPSGEVENVKGATYSLDALLGMQVQEDLKHVATAPNGKEPSEKKNKRASWWKVWRWGEKDSPTVMDVGNMDEEERFAVVNGISYTLPGLLSGSGNQVSEVAKAEALANDTSVPTPDASIPTSSTPADAAKVQSAIAPSSSWLSTSPEKKSLYFAVIYLAPGDYHRFHSPTDWVCTRRRHFAGELFSVSPYLQNMLANLFVLNERVVLIGKWRYGLFTMTPVGATNVGSIKIHFDKELRTNSLTHDATAADAHPERGYAEAVYNSASRLLGGYPLVKGAEIGGFNLGSTIVLVFEAPDDEEKKFEFCVERGQTVRVGEKFGVIRKKGEGVEGDW